MEGERSEAFPNCAQAQSLNTGRRAGLASRMAGASILRRPYSDCNSRELQVRSRHALLMSVTWAETVECELLVGLTRELATRLFPVCAHDTLDRIVEAWRLAHFMEAAK